MLLSGGGIRTNGLSRGQHVRVLGLTFRNRWLFEGPVLDYPREWSGSGVAVRPWPVPVIGTGTRGAEGPFLSVTIAIATSPPFRQSRREVHSSISYPRKKLYAICTEQAITPDYQAGRSRCGGPCWQSSPTLAPTSRSRSSLTGSEKGGSRSSCSAEGAGVEQSAELDATVDAGYREPAVHVLRQDGTRRSTCTRSEHRPLEGTILGRRWGRGRRPGGGHGRGRRCRRPGADAEGLVRLAGRPLAGRAVAARGRRLGPSGGFDRTDGANGSVIGRRGAGLSPGGAVGARCSGSGGDGSDRWGNRARRGSHGRGDRDRAHRCSRDRAGRSGCCRDGAGRSG
jgi:hypothetical protein